MHLGACLMMVCATLRAAAPTTEEIEKFAKTRPELDQITWKDPARGAPLAVRILGASGDSITVEKTLATGLTLRTIPLSDLAGISFKLTTAELLLHREAKISSIPSLRVLWSSRRATLRLTGSNAAVTGLVLARSLRLSGEPEALDEAGKILVQIRNQDPSKINVEHATAEDLTLRFILSQKSGNLTESDRLAWEITEGPENVDGMLLATAFLGERHFSDLKSTEREHPRWMDEDDILPLRQRLYHLTLDFFLYPSLFHGTSQAEASLGLQRAAQVHQYTGANALMKSTLDDLAALYPESTATHETAAQLARLTDREATGKLNEPEPAAKAEIPTNTTPTAPPPPPRRYNIFGE